MDGLSLLKVLRSRGVDLPAVLITSAPDRRVRSRAAEAGAAIIEKPLFGDLLSATLRAGLAAPAKAA
jgi:DNA-binding response OmpR family regulator